MNKSKITLFNDKKDCCDCTACKSICPKDAIYIYLDEYGFEYPKIDRNKCIECGLCKKVCAFQNIEETNTPIETYVGVAKDENILLKSASGGIFATIAQMYLQNKGVVFGATLDNELNPIHMYVDDINLLNKLQGSKYVQSNIENTYREAKRFLIEGKKVLFSGTPCQIAGLKGYLMKDYDNLLTIDIICHGVPSPKFFKDYLKVMEEKLGGKIKEFKFRDKSMGWGLNGTLTYEYNGILKEKKIYGSESSYYHYFLNSSCYRENCYHCKYACDNRPGDITIGDYWGIEAAHPNLLGKGKLEEEKGISVVIANTEKGKREIEKCDKFYRYSSEFSKARIKNEQLNKASEKGEKYSELMKIYKNEGYTGIENLYYKEVGIRRYKSRVKAIIPLKIKRIVKQYI
ncbi:Coenzyme F420 hydrogenase/dehydrogenase, beta subunit C-terminal domain [uncultured Clostridium sp.]|uniref:Coenzyme F420 hydrogenase/dehydrogenase, beta subunit C-terminal domain n=1 Tax=uncultured Clostridium sp. TaxID=59620 RepID=UPI0025E62412|nr:Coenzyme F420 hydrogenase/dehydrogenase, beta subunit C-terminal domain [uncultured Clostridium sp.]